MMPLKDRSLRILAVLAIVLWVSTCSVLLFQHQYDVAMGVSLGVVISLITVAYSFLSIRNAFQNSTKTFYKNVFSGMAVRFVIFIITLFLIFKFTTFSIYGFIAAFFTFYLIFQIIEIRLVTTELNKQQDV
mgnify:CR=1 FL=1